MNIEIHLIAFGTPEYDEAVRLRYDIHPNNWLKSTTKFTWPDLTARVC